MTLDDVEPSGVLCSIDFFRCLPRQVAGLGVCVATRSPRTWFSMSPGNRRSRAFCVSGQTSAPNQRYLTDVPPALSEFSMVRALSMMVLALLLTGCVTTTQRSSSDPGELAGGAGDTYDRGEIVDAMEDYLGVSAETAGSIVERLFAEQGRPNAYIYGEEASGAIGVGARYGQGTLVTKSGEVVKVYWQGPSVGWDIGGNASKTFTLVYNLPRGDQIYRRFPGVEGSAYLIGGVGVNYQRADGITLAPMRAGVGARLGANIGYLAYSRERNILPF
jgi:hypothetical protein